MNRNLIIVASPADMESVKDFRKNFEGSEVNLEIVEMPSAGSFLVNPEETEECLLWLTPQTDIAVYELSKRRRDKGLSSLNILPERLPFSQEQRGMVGRNPSVIIPLTKGDIAAAIMARLNRKGTSVAAETTSTNEVASGNPAPSVAPTQPTPTQPRPQEREVRPVERRERVNISSPPSSTSMAPEEKEKKAVRPSIVLIAGIGLIFISCAIARAFEYKVDDLADYITFGGAGYLTYLLAGALGEWRKRNGKTIFSWIVLILIWLLIILYIYFLCVDAYSYLFN